MLRVDQLGRRPEHRHGKHQALHVLVSAPIEEFDIRRGAHVTVHADRIPANEHELDRMRVERPDEIEKVLRERRISGIVRMPRAPSTRHSLIFEARPATELLYAFWRLAVRSDARATAVSRSAAAEGGCGGACAAKVVFAPVHVLARRTDRTRAAASLDGCCCRSNATETSTRLRSRMAVSNDTCARIPRSSSLIRRGLTFASIASRAMESRRSVRAVRSVAARSATAGGGVDMTACMTASRTRVNPFMYVSGKPAPIARQRSPFVPHQAVIEYVADIAAATTKPNDRQRLSLGAKGRYSIAPPGLEPGLF